jgi:hypothetical protein
MHSREMPAVNATGNSGKAEVSCCVLEQKACCNGVVFKSGGVDEHAVLFSDSQRAGLPAESNQVFCNSLFPEIELNRPVLTGRFSASAANRGMLLRIRWLAALTGEIFVIRHVVHSVKLDQRNSFFGVNGRADLWIGRGCL